VRAFTIGINEHRAHCFILFAQREEQAKNMKDDLIFLAASCVNRQRLFLDKHLDGYATIQFTPRGGVEVGYDDEWFLLTGRAWFWPAHPGARIRFRPAPGYHHWPHRHVGFRGALVEEWRASGLWLERPQAAPASRDAKGWDWYFAELTALSRRADGLGRRRAINRVEDLLLEMADVRKQEARGAALEYSWAQAPWLHDFVEKLSVDPQRVQSTPDYSKLARDFQISEATLRRQFKSALGVSPHSYWLRSRADAARILLSETDLPLKAIASRLGYENEYFFSRQFKQFAGVAPGVFRKSRMGTSRTSR
jgi:AraC-like DNA-binding protein